MENEYELKYSKYFGSWADSIEPFYNNGGLKKVQEFLKKEKSEGKTLLPFGNLIFRAFKEVDIEKVKVILLGLSPYPQIGIPDGLLFSNSLTKQESPSLKIIFDSIEDNLGYKDDRNRDLTRWTRQNILMLNCALTCTVNQPLAHEEIWRPFTTFLFQEVFNKKELIILYFGKQASGFSIFENKDLHKSMQIEHPAYASRQNRPLIHKNCWTWVNEQLKLQGKSPVNWQEYSDLPFKETEEVKYKEFI